MYSFFSVFPSIKCEIFFILTVFCVCGTLSSDFEPGGKPEIKLINPDAEAVIGVSVNVRERGSGLFGCGERRLDGIITTDALKWVVDDLNKRIWSESSSNVSLGLHIMDSCGRTRTAASQLVEFLPELQNNEKPNRTSIPFKFCIIDDIGLGREVDISKSLNDIKIPVVEAQINVNSPQILINSVLLFIQELRWEHVAIVYSNSRFSTSMLKYFTKLLKKFELCVPWVLNVDDGDEELQNVFKSGIPVLLLLPSEEHSLFFKMLQDTPKIRKKIPIVFSDLVSREQLKMIPGNFQILSVIPYPEKEPEFENYFSKNSIMKGIQTEDKLDLVQRTKTVRKVKHIGKKLSDALRNVLKEVCNDKNGLCSELIAVEGRNLINKELGRIDWTDGEQLYELVEYQYQFPDDHIYLHKIMAYNGHKNLEIFETNISYMNVNCEGENHFRPECRCLEVKSVRVGSARNIDDWGDKKLKQSKNNLEKEKHKPPVPDIQSVGQSLRKPMVYASLNDPLNGTLACLTLLGGLLTLVIAQYFATFAALPKGGLTTGTSVIGYVILIGLFLLFTTNVNYLLTPLIPTCALRRIGPSFSYAVIFSGMLIKVWSSYRQFKCEKAKVQKPFTLLFYSGSYSFLQVFLSGLWLLLKPPATEYTFENKWSCYPYGDFDTHLIITMIYPVILLLITIVVAIRTCSKCNNDEARWILISSSLVAIILSCWGVAIATNVWQLHRTPCTNLAAGTILLLCLYIPKIKMHSELKKSQKEQAKTLPVPLDIDKDCSVFPNPQFPVVLGYNVVPPVLPKEIIEPNYINQAYSIDESSETVSLPFDIDTSSYSEIEQEPYTFSTFLEDPQVHKIEESDLIDDPTQVVPSTLYPLEMFSNEPIAISSDHCQPGTNEFTPPHRATSQLYLCPEPEWVP